MSARRQTVLVVDDEDDIRAIVRQMLATEGYVVLDAGDPHHALRLAGQQTVDLLITDVVMPLMRGTELAQRLLAVVPTAKVLLMSAYKVAEITASGHPFLAKPFTPEMLRDRVRELLRDEPSPFARKPPGRPR
jgi:two-component system, cell cycle sensor histidine kinase and response regulator CckA